jgi:hypothetical protein
MRRIHLISAAAVAVVVLIAAVAAYANAPASQTTFKLDVSSSPKKAGTKSKPKPVKTTLNMTGGTTTAGDSPATSTKIDIQLPSTQKWYGSKWPKSKRCAPQSSADKAACPAGSKIGTGHVVATNRSDPTKPKIVEQIDLTAYVMPSGGLGLLVEGTSPLPFSALLPGKISKKNTKISVSIPDNVQEPLAGVPTGIEQLKFTLSGKIKSKGKTYGAISSIGCKSKKWKTTVTNFYRDGKHKDDDTVKCSAAKKKKK